jgi:hypothetical protein
MKLQDNTAAVERLFDNAARSGVYPITSRLRFHINQIFDGLDLSNKNVLEIGGGNGLLSLYAGASGASKVVCLDPEASGSTSGTQKTFQKLCDGLVLPNVCYEAVDFESFDSGHDKFDVILLYNSINHLNEDACIRLLKSSESQGWYQKIFDKVRAVSAPGAKLILCDCAPSNFFRLIGVRNPFAPTIEWEKHQDPTVWRRMLSEVGFANPRIRWRSFNVLRRPGQVVLGNRLAAYFMESHFRLEMELSA